VRHEEITRTAKKLFAMVFCFLILVSVVGCSGDTPTLTDEEQDRYLSKGAK